MSRVIRSISPRWLDLYLGALVLAFVVVCLGPSLLGLRTFLSVNILSSHWPWFADGVHTVGHEQCTSDTIDAFMPGIANARAQLYSGHLPNWQSAVSGGSPLASTPNLGLLDPLSLPYFVLPLRLAPAFVKLFELIAAIGGTFLYARRIGLSRAAGLLGGFVFATTGFMVVWSNWPQSRVAALIPVLFWTVERLVQRGRAGDVALVALAVASIALGGFPAVAGLTIYLAGIYLVVRAIVVHRQGLRSAWATIGLALGGLALGFGLAMVQLLPFASQLNDTDLGYRTGYATIGLQFSSLITLFVPDADGLCLGSTSTAGSGSNAVVEIIAYVGAGAVVLAVAGAASGFRRRHSLRGARSFFTVAVVVILLLGWGSTVFREAVANLPIFENNFIGRIRALLGFVIAVLVAAGFDVLLRQDRRHLFGRERDDGTNGSSRVALRQRVTRPAFVWTASVWVIGAGLGAVILWRAHRGAVAEQRWVMLKHALWTPAWLMLGTLVLVALSLSGRTWLVRAAAVLVPAIVLAQGAWFFHSFLPGDRNSDFYPDTAAHRFLGANLGSERFVGVDSVLYPATALYYGLRTPTGHAFTQSTWQDLLRAVDPAAMRTPTFSDLTLTTLQASGVSPVLDRLGVKYVAWAPGVPSGAVPAIPAATASVPAGSTPATCTLPGQPVRGITVRLATAVTAARPTEAVSLEVTATNGTRTLVNRRILGKSVPAGSPIATALAGEDLPTGGSTTFTFRFLGAESTAMLSADGTSALCKAIVPSTTDQLRLVYADSGVSIFQRLTALDRIRWAATSTVITDSAAQVAALTRGVPADQVVLSTGGAPTGSGKAAQLTVRTDRPGRVVTDVTAQGDGYVVVADAIQQKGWTATVDGASAALVAADHAMGAVHVTAGPHQVVLSYRAPGQRAGALATAVSVLIVVALFVWDRRRRPTGAHHQ